MNINADSNATAYSSQIPNAYESAEIDNGWRQKADIHQHN